MNVRSAVLALLVAAIAVAPATSWGQSSRVPGDSLDPQLWVVGTAHLDTQWRWTIQQTIGEFIPDTFRKNMALMRIYPDYVFSFEGAFHYMMMQEYFPDEFEQVRPFVKSGQWRVTGSWVDAVDVNMPSFESLVRQTLYGNGYFKQEFGKTSRDVYLPDCFGFGYALPSIAHHCGLSSFSTQKLAWGCWVGTPFDIGVWQGVDGSTLLCGVNPGSYSAGIEDDLSRDTTWINAADRTGEKSGFYAAYHYFGTGDTGGSPDSASVAMLDKSIKSDGPLRVHSIGADDINNLIPDSVLPKLPHYNGELVMTRHGVGCYTSEAAMKRWNRRNELLADAAERAAVIADHVSNQEYPRDLLRDAWIRFIWHQFHDDLTGTNIPEAYEFSWNDELLCQNRFAAALTSAVDGASTALDTRTKGTPLVVYNTLSIPREDIVEGIVPLKMGDAKHVRVIGPDGAEVPADATLLPGDSVHVRFLAKVPSTGYAVYDVQASETPSEVETALKVGDSSLENERYRVAVNDKGEVASIFDKKANMELLSAPIRYQFLEDTPKRWPAWEIDYDDITAAPLDLITGPPVIRVEENGRARVALHVVQKTANSVINTTISLAAGAAGNRVEFKTDIDWAESAKLLKVAVSTTTANDSATYDLGLGTINRGLDFDKRYEVPAHQWVDLTSPDRTYGVAVLNDSRYGWDHPEAATLRLSLVRTPGVADGWEWVGDQSSQDQGRHELTFAVEGHAGDWRDGAVAWQAARLNQPLAAFAVMPHDGSLGKTYSFVSLSTAGNPSQNPPVMICATKLAEASNEIVIRVRELDGQNQGDVLATFDRPVVSAREINGVEDEVGPAAVVDGKLQFSLTPYQPKAFAVTLAPLDKGAGTKQASAVVTLPFNLDGISTDAERCDGDFDGHGFTMAGELVPDTLDYLGTPFVFGPKADSAMNVVACDGQQIALPSGKYDRLYLLAASINGPASTSFVVDKNTYPVDLQDWADPIGQWNNRMTDGQMVTSPDKIAPSYINRLPVAWYGSHRHTAECKNDIYRFTYLFQIELPITPGAKTLTLPADSNVRVLAATLMTKPAGDVVPVQPLYDHTQNTLVRIAADSSSFAGQAKLTMTSPIPAVDIYYTLDGSEPTVSSTHYAGPVTVDNTTTVKARAIRAGYHDQFVAAKTVNRLDLKTGVTTGALAPGLEAVYYEGEWERLPGFDTLSAVSSFTADAVAIPETARDEDYGLTFRGFVKVPADGIYAFSLTSDDGSRLYVADSLLVDNDGLHGEYEMTGLVGLKAGVYPIVVDMFQGKGDEALKLLVAGPDLPKQAIPASMLFHETK